MAGLSLTLDLESINRDIIPTLSYIQQNLQASFRECCSIPLVKMAEDSWNEAAWKVFLLIPRLNPCQEVVEQAYKSLRNVIAFLKRRDGENFIFLHIPDITSLYCRDTSLGALLERCKTSRAAVQKRRRAVTVCRRIW